jgi:putative ABC transport system ATP-binding protein
MSSSLTSENVLSFLKRLNKEEGKTIVMVTHDEDLAKEAARIEYLRDGKIVKTLKR